MHYELRALTREDIPAWNRLLAAVEAVDAVGEHYDEADLEEELANPDIEVGKDVVGAYDGEELVGFFQVYPRSSDGAHQKTIVHGATHPAHRGRGLGGLLVEHMLARADEVHAEKRPDLPAKLTLTGRSDDAAQQDLLGRFGLLPERWSFVMRADLHGGLPGPEPLAEGLVLRRYDDSLADALLAAHNEAFQDHPNFAPWTEVMWKQWVTGSRSFRPEVSFVVREPDAPERVVAYVQSAEWEANFAATGRREAYVGKVGTLRAFRGRGLATTLLRHALVAYRDAGYDEASLIVDSENPTGALGVYRRAGFEVETRMTDYTLVRPALTP